MAVQLILFIQSFSLSVLCARGPVRRGAGDAGHAPLCAEPSAASGSA